MTFSYQKNCEIEIDYWWIENLQWVGQKCEIMRIDFGFFFFRSPLWTMCGTSHQTTIIQIWQITIHPSGTSTAAAVDGVTKTPSPQKNPSHTFFDRETMFNSQEIYPFPCISAFSTLRYTLSAVILFIYTAAFMASAVCARLRCREKREKKMLTLTGRPACLPVRPSIHLETVHIFYINKEWYSLSFQSTLSLSTHVFWISIS